MLWMELALMVMLPLACTWPLLTRVPPLKLMLLAATAPVLLTSPLAVMSLVAPTEPELLMLLAVTVLPEMEPPLLVAPRLTVWACMTPLLPVAPRLTLLVATIWPVLVVEPATATVSLPYTVPVLLMELLATDTPVFIA